MQNIVGVQEFSTHHPYSKKPVRVVLSNTRGVTEFDAKHHAPRVVYLDLNSTRLESLASIQGSMEQLQTLDISYTTVSNIDDISRFSNLRTLGLNGLNVSDISPLSTLTKLTSLSLSGTQIADLGPLNSLKHLSRLNVSNTRVTAEALQKISGLLHLRDIDVRGTGITETQVRMIFKAQNHNPDQFLVVTDMKKQSLFSDVMRQLQNTK